MSNSKEIKRFVEESKSYLLFDANNLDKIKKCFLTAIDSDEKKFGEFEASLPELKQSLKDDLAFFMESDPAADSEREILLAYPGYKAIRYHRIAHILYELGEKLNARIISEEAHVQTGVDIHPGAQIDCPIFIDHATGIVVGETTIIGKRVKIYQSVTLGALSLSKGHDLYGKKRHPTIGNDVTIYAGVSILGDISIGDRVTIGSNVFLTKSIPSDMKVTIGEPELVLQKRNKK